LETKENETWVEEGDREEFAVKGLTSRKLKLMFHLTSSKELRKL
jgi:hypothetical protein